MPTWCAECGEGFHAVEYRPSSPDPDVPDFCSDVCEDRYYDSLECSRVYEEGRRGGAPVF